MAGFGGMVNGGAAVPRPGENQQDIDQGAAPMEEGAEATDDPRPNVTPEEQAQYDMLVRNALKIIYPEGEEATISPNVLTSLKGGDKPIMNLAATAVMLVKSLRDSAKKAGTQINDEVLFHAGIAIIEELAEVAEAAKIHDYSEEEQENALYLALDMYRAQGEQSGDVDKESLKQGWDEIVAADREGRVGEVLPGIEGRMQKAEGAEQAEAEEEQ